MKKIFGGIVFGLLALVGLSLGLTSCLDSGGDYDPVTQLLRDIETIDNYLTSNNITAVKDVNGIRMVITELGTGLPALLSSTVDVDYVGKLFANNVKFDEGNIKGQVANYIDGWKIALITLPAGSKATLYIPPYWGYGNAAQGPIPANSILIFDIEFNDVVESTQELQRLASDTVAIDQYLTLKGIDAVKDSTGIRYVINELGSGPIPTWYDKVKMEFSFKLVTDDTKVVVEDSVEPTENFYSRVVDYIHAMKIALQKLPEGSKATLYVPSGLAFGAIDQKNEAGQIIIPANSNIIIELELLDVVLP